MTNSQLSGTTSDPDSAALIQAIPRVATTVRDSALFEDARTLLLQVFETWKEDDINLKECKEGITNKLVMCINKTKDTTVLIRAYGKNTDFIIDRNSELLNMIGLARIGMCPPVYARFDNGLMYGFIPGTVAKPEEMGNELWAPLIAQKLAEWSQISLPGSNAPQLFPTLRRWMRDIPKSYKDPKANDTFRSYFSMEKLSSELAELDSLLTKLNSPVVFAHNDLLSGNIIMSESKDQVFFIDYEYGMYNHRAFDIANHFNEYAGFECDYTRYPTKETQLKWFKIYLDTLGQDSGEAALEALYKEVSFFQLASHFYWGIWGLIQAAISDIDFDYMEYAKMRFEQYYKIKSQLLA
ncbi:hypothetical protein IW140_003043 [Coemansia sp. RSA 1813]|nr:hypothetical protein EV178_004202 [Coemansia sp. RSA 1646]KAJ1771316.1 hypothetical protein LPJ74_002467 [Coemansia sp. RSA 1843]KAJ2088970.1 hypothetical protein IW138_003811 [Coemansia sp. RSA 986]KAJ2213223.1 hypothetical protein EV179_004010 [Coemansia sp. RSA 487]KAJ2569489.1 hypothetical protein IW140_003043 [Coemansia sp. RSA 1813]